ncbi:MAG TPA: hypothetical protein VJZ71_05815 [Phycisphaerae bacterium]|nr:hypothetical protein [Phycisphaerae bacterium]
MNSTSMPTEFQPCGFEALGPHEYTWFHRSAWPLLLHVAGCQLPAIDNLKSWMRLWGRLGAELFACFKNGDEFIRSDMISLANEYGGWRGRLVAGALRRWQANLAT